ncbi:MAG: type II toxin-antitoxin system RelE/ParE family toxin [Planctomycetia bacterium]|nr:type II toxin-antitoxin system RelE/ParE family toxin [Planctomycetia bacterium]
MPQFLRARRAEEDLFEIVSAITIENRSAAESMIDRFNETFRRLADHPLIGEQLRSSRKRDVRLFPVGNYVVYYRPVVEGVLILRVWHAARGNPPKL